MKKILTTSAAVLAVSLATASVQADTLGFSIAAKGYQSNLSAEVKDETTDFKFDSEMNTEFSFAFEHPVPVIPNIRLASADFSFETKNSIGPGGGSKLTFDQGYIDGTFYYELLDNIVELDLGLTARMMDVSVDNGDYKDDTTSALLFAKIQGNLPVTGLSVGALAQAGGNADDAITDIEIYAQYEFAFGLGLSAGYRVIEQTFNLEAKGEDDIEIDMDFDGTYIALFYHF